MGVTTLVFVLHVAACECIGLCNLAEKLGVGTYYFFIVETNSFHVVGVGAVFCNVALRWLKFVS